MIELAAYRTPVRTPASPAWSGPSCDAVSEDEVALTVRFATTDVAYTGWTWCVTVALVDPEQPTVSEVVLLPGPDSLLPPPWLPWRERIRPGDLGPGDLLLPPLRDDPRLVPAYLESDDPAVEDVAHELGIGRVRVMSRAGRVDTAERWREGGSSGRTADMAKQAPLNCVMCAFFLPLAGSLGARVRRLRQRDVAGRRPGRRPGLRLRRALGERHRTGADRLPALPHRRHRARRAPAHVVVGRRARRGRGRVPR